MKRNRISIKIHTLKYAINFGITSCIFGICRYLSGRYTSEDIPLLLFLFTVLLFITMGSIILGLVRFKKKWWLYQSYASSKN